MESTAEDRSGQLVEPPNDRAPDSGCKHRSATGTSPLPFVSIPSTGKRSDEESFDPSRGVEIRFDFPQRAITPGAMCCVLLRGPAPRRWGCWSAGITDPTLLTHPESSCTKDPPSSTTPFYQSIGKDYEREGGRATRGHLEGRSDRPGTGYSTRPCGTGLHLQHLKKLYQVEGLDHSPGMLDVASPALSRYSFSSR